MLSHFIFIAEKNNSLSFKWCLLLEIFNELILFRKSIKTVFTNSIKPIKGQKFLSLVASICSCSRATRSAAAASQLPTFAKMQKKKVLQNRAESFLRNFVDLTNGSAIKKEKWFVFYFCVFCFIISSFKPKTWTTASSFRLLQQKKLWVEKPATTFEVLRKTISFEGWATYISAQTSWYVWQRSEKREKGARGETVWWLLLPCERFPSLLSC